MHKAGTGFICFAKQLDVYKYMIRYQVYKCEKILIAATFPQCRHSAEITPRSEQSNLKEPEDNSKRTPNIN